MLRTAAAALVALAGASIAPARQEPSEPREPAVQPGHVRPRPDPEGIKPTGTGKPDAVHPAGPGSSDGTIPGLEDADFRVAIAPLRSEGTFLVEQRGTMIKLAGGEQVLVFHPDRKRKRERPMVLLPCQRLQQMMQLAADRGEAPVMVVSGQVFAYLNVNYLLPTMARVVAPEAPKNRGKPAEAPPEAAADPAVRDLVKELESQREASRAPEGPARTEVKLEEIAARQGERPLIPEGQALVRRRGRMTRLPTGDWTFTIDNATSGDTKSDGPLTMARCLTLQRMESQAQLRGEAVSFEVSGRVLAYDGRNYLMPTMFQVYPAVDLEARH